MGDFPKFDVFPDRSGQSQYGSATIHASDDTRCVCGHLASSHRTYGCIGWSGSPSAKPGRTYCECGGFKSAGVKRAPK
jgi:hypothetical protein